MESNLRLLILRIILACVVLNAVLTVESKKHKHNNLALPSVDHTLENIENVKISKKSHQNSAKKAKRSAYGRSWSSKEYSNMPPYLVFNRKTGAYYPYYTHHDNNIRRNMLQSSLQGGYRARNY